MLTDQLQAYLDSFARSLMGTGKGGACTGGHNITAAEVAVFAQAEVNNLRLGLACCRQYVFVIAVEHSKAILRQIKHDFAFGLADVFHATQKLHVGFAHVGNQTAVRLGNAAQLGNLAQPAHAHLHNGNIGIRLNAQQGFRQTDFIIEVALSFDNIIFAAQAGSQQILRRGFAVGACDSKNLQSLLTLTVGMRKLLISKQRILYHEHSNARRQAANLMGYNNARSTQLHSLGTIVMAVKIIALQRYE